MNLGRYSFIPWVRQGLANAIQTPTGSQIRATTHVSLTIEGKGGSGNDSKNIERDVEIYGPGDVIGIDSQQIIHTEPRHWVTDFEPNYLPYIEFYQEDFVWRYSPEAATGDRLKPWLALVVLRSDEFTAQNLADRPLPFIQITDQSKSLPDLENAWAWAHVHVNESITGDEITSNNESEITDKLTDALNRNPDLAYSRLICARRLIPKTQYKAFLVPTFETGRLAGLGLSPDLAPGALHHAWGQAYPTGEQPEPQSLPVYHQWQFETSERGDFEYLVWPAPQKLIQVLC